MIDHWPALDDLPIETRRGLPVDPVLAQLELQRRQRAVRKLVAFFRERPWTRVSMEELAHDFGIGGFRTRVSEARRFVFEPEGGQLKNERVRIEGSTRWTSVYMYQPQRPLGRDASELTQATLFTTPDRPFAR